MHSHMNQNRSTYNTERTAYRTRTLLLLF